MKIFLCCTVIAALIVIPMMLWALSPDKRELSLAAVLPLAAALTILAFDAWGIASMLPREKEPVEISVSLPEAQVSANARVYLIDVTVDGIKQSKSALSSGAWQAQDLGYFLPAGSLSVETGLLDVLHLQMPVGTERSLIFETGPDHPDVMISCNGFAQIASCGGMSGETGIAIPNSEADALHRLWKMQLIAYAVILFIFYTIAAALIRRYICRKASCQSVSGRNGAVDVCRFLASIVIVILHAQIKLGLKGYLGVEFFFILSGWLLAAHHQKQQSSSTVSIMAYTKSRLLGFYPQFLLVWMIYAVIVCLQTKAFFPAFIGRHAGELLLIRSFGFDVWDVLLRSDWYLSSMFISSVILYTLYTHCRRIFSTPIPAVLAAAFLGYMSKVCGTLNLTSFTPDGGLLFTFGFWRGLAEMTLGCSLYELSRHTVLSNETNVSRKKWAGVTELLLISLLAVIIFTSRDSTGDTLALVMVSVLIYSLMTQQSVLTKILNGPLASYLGKISLPIYLWHMVILDEMDMFFPALSFVQRVLITLAVSLILSSATLPAAEAVTRAAKKLAASK